MTNRDKLNQLNNQELAEFITSEKSVCEFGCPYMGYVFDTFYCEAPEGFVCGKGHQVAVLKKWLDRDCT